MVAVALLCISQTAFATDRHRGSGSNQGRRPSLLDVLGIRCLGAAVARPIRAAGAAARRARASINDRITRLSQTQCRPQAPRAEPAPAPEQDGMPSSEDSFNMDNLGDGADGAPAEPASPTEMVAMRVNLDGPSKVVQVRDVGSASRRPSAERLQEEELRAAGASMEAPPADPRPAPAAPEEINDDIQKGTVMYRKGRKCTVMKVDRAMDPPSYIVRMEDTKNEVNTERSRLSRLPPQAGLDAPDVIKKGDTMIRNGRPCVVVKVEHEDEPPSYTVRMIDTGNEVNTVRERLSRPPQQVVSEPPAPPVESQHEADAVEPLALPLFPWRREAELNGQNSDSLSEEELPTFKTGDICLLKSPGPSEDYLQDFLKRPMVYVIHSRSENDANTYTCSRIHPDDDTTDSGTTTLHANELLPRDRDDPDLRREFGVHMDQILRVLRAQN